MEGKMDNVVGNEEAWIDERIASLLEYRCKDKYSIEPHGDGHALYFGRCGHRHGYNILHINECTRGDILKLIADRLNNKGPSQ